MKSRNCPMCGNDFVSLRKTSRYCSTKCRMRAHRAWSKAKEKPLVKKALRGVTLLARASDGVTEGGDA